MNSHSSEKNQRIEKAISGDRDAILEILLETKTELKRFVAAKLSDSPHIRAQEDDILQETYIRACREIGSLRVDNLRGLMAWLRAIALNQVRDAARRSAAAKRGGDRGHVKIDGDAFADCAIGLVAELADPKSDTPSQFAARSEAVDAMRVALANLPPEQREAIRLHCFERYSLNEAAARMNRTTDSVRGLIQRAKQSLRDSMHASSLWLSKKR